VVAPSAVTSFAGRIGRCAAVAVAAASQLMPPPGLPGQNRQTREDRDNRLPIWRPGRVIARRVNARRDVGVLDVRI
jgi:hypothetical protein